MTPRGDMASDPADAPGRMDVPATLVHRVGIARGGCTEASAWLIVATHDPISFARSSAPPKPPGSTCLGPGPSRPWRRRTRRPAAAAGDHGLDADSAASTGSAVRGRSVSASAGATSKATPKRSHGASPTSRTSTSRCPRHSVATCVVRHLVSSSLHEPRRCLQPTGALVARCRQHARPPCDATSARGCRLHASATPVPCRRFRRTTSVAQTAQPTQPRPQQIRRHACRPHHQRVENLGTALPLSPQFRFHEPVQSPSRTASTFPVS